MASVQDTAVQRLDRLFTDEWERELRDYPEYATQLGDRRYNGRWTDWSPAAIAARAEADQRAWTQLQAIERSALPEPQQLHRDTFEWQLQHRIERQRYAEHLQPLTHQGGVQQADTLVQQLSFDAAGDYRDWLARMAALPRLVDQTIDLMRQGLREGLMPPRVLLTRVPGQIRAQIVDDPAKSPFYRPLTRFPDSVTPDDRRRLEAQAQDLVREQIVPAYRRLLAFVEGEYLPRTRASIAATDRPDPAEGRAYYDFLARYYTSTTQSAEGIHATGLNEVARLRAAMERLKEQIGFKGTLVQFFQHLRSDPAFFKSSPEALLEAYRAISKRIDPELVRVLRTVPRLPYGVRAIPDHVAPDTTTAYYQPGAMDGSRPGYYFVNLYKPDVRPTWEMMPLSLHEAVPGHHTQFARAAELGALPAFRRNAYFVAYGEGWALYAEKLGYDMGLYDDPYDRFGQLTYEMWRAVRLVVDTGMHAKGWSRERAIAYFAEHAPKTEQDIVNEVDRYIAWPGQALAYKIGEMVISDLRTMATRELGPKFDLRDFNDEVLATGSVPLAALQRRIEAWVAARR